MITLSGKSVYQDICIGKIHFLMKEKNIIQQYHIENTQKEIKRFENAKQEGILQLQGLYQKAIREAGDENAAIFEIHQMLMDDDDYCESIIQIINNQKVNAEFAISSTSDNFSQMFASLDDTYMQGRAADIVDVSNHLLNILSGGGNELETLQEPAIIAADDLLPSETIKLDKRRVLGFAIQNGSVNSHTAILARSMGIPALVSLGKDFDQKYNGATAIIDGFSGKIYLEPDDLTKLSMAQRQKEIAEGKQLLASLKGKESITLDGKTIHLYANIGSVSDVNEVLLNDAEGIGLFRSEFLYLENDNYPTEEQQFSAYKSVVENMGGKKVIIRTMDIGADKQADYFQLENEENPALGYRAIRICLTKTDIFKTQLRAIYRAALFGTISIMFPMIISLNEIIKIKKIMSEVKEELTEEGIPFKDNVEVGIMIETPAAALISDELVKEVEFFSIGTNDLTQYTLAIDRQNQKLEEFYEPHHPAILKMIQIIADNAHKAGKWVGICGELASDITLTETFIRMGIDELSVSPKMVLALRKKIREIDTSLL